MQASPPAHVPPAITVAKRLVNLPITLQPLHLVIAVIKNLAHLPVQPLITQG